MLRYPGSRRPRANVRSLEFSQETGREPLNWGRVVALK